MDFHDFLTNEKDIKFLQNYLVKCKKPEKFRSIIIIYGQQDKRNKLVKILKDEIQTDISTLWICDSEEECYFCEYNISNLQSNFLYFDDSCKPKKQLLKNILFSDEPYHIIGNIDSIKEYENDSTFMKFLRVN